MWQPLFANLAVISMMLVMWNALSDQIDRLPAKWRPFAFGLAMAAGAVGSMMLAYEVSAGVFFDLRAPIIAIAGMFGGPFASLATALAAFAYRVFLGGAVVAGAVTILFALALGLAGHFLAKRRPRHLGHVVVLACFVSMATLPSVFILPADARNALLPALAEPMLLTLLSTTLLGAVMLAETRRRDLALSNRLYRSMVEALPDCLNIKDLEGRFLAANPATARLMGAASSADLLGKTDFDFYPSDLAASYRRDEVEVLRKGEHQVVEQPGRLPDGRAGWLSTLKSPVHDDERRPIGLITHNRDITVQRELQDRLVSTQAHLDQALEHMTDGLAMYDADGILMLCNARYRNLFPKTAGLRRPGSHFADIIRASVEAGEEQLPPATTLAEHVAAKWLALKTDGECELELTDGQTFLSKTRILPNGCTLRMMTDITERRSFERNLEHLALHDPLTGLANRALFNTEIDRRLGRARTDGDDVIVMLLDLDWFKQVNDTYGHAAGDRLLVSVARRLEASVRPGDVVARLGGDEFAILVSGGKCGIDANALAERVMANLRQPLSFDDTGFLPSCTLGFTVFPQDRSDADGLIRHADKALYAAKAQGRGTWRAFASSSLPEVKAAG
jgi:diguanylate cyclase (GGDEF)-like protein/PAS domain S-box-containing protein